MDYFKSYYLSGKTNLSQRFRVVLALVSIGTLAGCSAPAVYRPEVDEFNKATTAVRSYVNAEQIAVESIRSDLREDMLKQKRPLLKIAAGCGEALAKLNEGASPVQPGKMCGLELVDNLELAPLFNPGMAFSNSAAFTDAVAAYAAALQKVATSSDKAAFLQATSGLGDAVISLAGSAANAAGSAPPDSSSFTPITNLLGLGAYYYLENKRSEALQKAAGTAHPWITKGAAAVSRVMYAADYEISHTRYSLLQNRIDSVNEATPAKYVAAADKAIKQSQELRQGLNVDPGAAMRRLPEAHAKLLEAFKDKKRNLGSAIAASKELFIAARDAHDAITAK